MNIEQLKDDAAMILARISRMLVELENAEPELEPELEPRARGLHDLVTEALSEMPAPPSPAAEPGQAPRPPRKQKEDATETNPEDYCSACGNILDPERNCRRCNPVGMPPELRPERDEREDAAEVQAQKRRSQTRTVGGHKVRREFDHRKET
jgi:hypothetical protein